MKCTPLEVWSRLRGFTFVKHNRIAVPLVLRVISLCISLFILLCTSFSEYVNTACRESLLHVQYTAFVLVDVLSTNHY